MRPKHIPPHKYFFIISDHEARLPGLPSLLLSPSSPTTILLATSSPGGDKVILLDAPAIEAGGASLDEGGGGGSRTAEGFRRRCRCGYDWGGEDASVEQEDQVRNSHQQLLRSLFSWLA